MVGRGGKENYKNPKEPVSKPSREPRRQGGGGEKWGKHYEMTGGFKLFTNTPKRTSRVGGWQPCRPSTGGHKINGKRNIRKDTETLQSFGKQGGGEKKRDSQERSHENKCGAGQTVAEGDQRKAR